MEINKRWLRILTNHGVFILGLGLSLTTLAQKKAINKTITPNNSNFWNLYNPTKAESPAVMDAKQSATYHPFLLPNGWSLSPVGRFYALGDLPLNLVLSPSHKYFGILNSGQSTQSIQVFSVAKQKIISEIEIPKTWYGLAFNLKEDRIYASGANDNIVRIYSFEEEHLKLLDSIILGKRWPFEKICPTGIAVNDAKKQLYVVTKEDSSLYTLDLASKAVINKIKLPSEAFSCKFDPQSQNILISLWGNKSMAIFNIASRSLTSIIGVGDHPNDFILNKSKSLLFTANANDNTVSIVDLNKKIVIETLSTTLYPTLLSGSTPDGLALSEDEKTLYIADADNNCLVVFDVSNPGASFSKGFIPTGWYPTQVRVLGNKIYVTNGKGLHSMANPLGPNPMAKNAENRSHTGYKPKQVQYIGGLFKGALSVIPIPTAEHLKTYTRWVYKNTPFNPKKSPSVTESPNNPIPTKVGGASPIKYVFYIIKENRTYDQVLGDMKEGNGDPSLCIFPENITPNQHALARNFVLLDNFYVDAEVSADGHNWSTAAYANDFVEKTWPTSYGGRGGNYDYEGTRSIAFPKDGFIWDHLQRAGISYRTYGEFAAYEKASIESLRGHTCTGYPGFELSIKDSDKERIWEKDFDSLLNHNAVPRFNSIRLGNDHTSGMRRGAYSIQAALADNDLSVGQLVEHLSNSPIWKESIVFVLEDDAQAGSDHIDAHRSTAYVVGPYVKRNSVIHDLYTTSGMIRTMELILGMKPMSQYDASALPMFNCFTHNLNLSPFVVISENYDINTRNTAWNEGARKSELMNFTKEDLAPAEELNRIIWEAMKGNKIKMPAPRHSAFVFLSPKSRDNEKDSD